MLGGKYVACMHDVEDPFERERWRRALSGLDAERTAVDPNDRMAQIRAKERWDAERRALRTADAGSVNKDTRVGTFR